MRLDGYWMDIGTPDRYLEASWDIVEGRVRTGAETNPEGMYIGSDCEIATGAKVGPRAIIGNRSILDSGSSVSNSVLISDCEVGSGAVVIDSILSPGVRVKGGVRVEGRVLGKNEVIDA